MIKLIVAVLILVLVAGGLYFFVFSKNQSTSTPSVSQNQPVKEISEKTALPSTSTAEEDFTALEKDLSELDAPTDLDQAINSL